MKTVGILLNIAYHHVEDIMGKFIIGKLVLVSFLFISGCGYQLANRPDSTSPITGKTVAIPLFANKVYRPHVEAVLTQSMVDEFAHRSGGGVVAEESAELVVKGAVTTYNSTQVAYSEFDRAKQNRLTVAAEAVLRERRTQRVLWKGALSLFQDYPANSDLALQQNSQDAALRDVCRRLAEQFYQQMSSAF
jgi:outer membrane lipopolysaccharide assembly protein LptE/RlpB